MTKSLTTFLKTQLNAQQQKAVTHPNGAVLVVAGAGSGKTRVITTRIAYLILQQNVSPSHIVALTFTNKAAGEMKERLTHFLGADTPLPFVGTFHSYCLLLLRTNRSIAPISEFTILDADDQQALIKKIIKHNNLEKQVRATQVAYQISRIKNSMLFSQDDLANLQPIFREIYHTYESEKLAAHSLDFDDLLVHALKMFETHQSFQSRMQEKIRHILVDEYQDTNIVQHRLLKYMAINEEKSIAIDSIAAVGDEDQSIYSWRGAAPANMLRFEKEFLPITKIKIEQNYRSVAPILAVANTVIAENTKRNPKKLWSTKKGTNRILLLSTRSEYHEAETIAACLKNLPKNKSLRDVGILYRTHFQSRALEEALIAHNIPYRIIGGIYFYARKEIKDLLAYMRLIINPHDRVSLFRIINCPARGLGPKFEQILLELWQHNPFYTFKQALSAILNDHTLGITGQKAIAVKEFLAIFSGLNRTIPTRRALDHMLRKTDYLNYLRKAYDTQDAEAKIENVRELIRSVMHAEQETNGETKLLTSFLNEIVLLQEKIDEHAPEKNYVQLMTLHASKGLEFETVMIAGLEEGIFPNSRSFVSLEALEEERRLFYVGITRAKEYLLLSHALYRNTFGQISDQIISRFLDETPPHLLQKIDLSNQPAEAIRPIFVQLMGGRTAPQPPQPIQSQKGSSHRALYTQAITLQQKQRTKTPANDGEKRWGKNKAVLHKKFGAGIIVESTKKSDNDYYVTAIFRCGKKKVLSRFLTVLK